MKGEIITEVIALIVEVIALIVNVSILVVYALILRATNKTLKEQEREFKASQEYNRKTFLSTLKIEENTKLFEIVASYSAVADSLKGRLQLQNQNYLLKYAGDFVHKLVNSKDSIFVSGNNNPNSANSTLEKIFSWYSDKDNEFSQKCEADFLELDKLERQLKFVFSNTSQFEKVSTLVKAIKEKLRSDFTNRSRSAISTIEKTIKSDENVKDLQEILSEEDDYTDISTSKLFSYLYKVSQPSYHLSKDSFEIDFHLLEENLDVLTQTIMSIKKETEDNIQDLGKGDF